MEEMTSNWCQVVSTDQGETNHSRQKEERSFSEQSPDFKVFVVMGFLECWFLKRVQFLVCVPVSALSVSLPPRGVACVFGFSASGRPCRLVSVFVWLAHTLVNRVLRFT